MAVDKFFTMCKMKIDEKNNKKERTVCKNCYNERKKNDYNKTLIQQSETDNVNKKNIIPEKQKNDNNIGNSAYDCLSHIIVGPRNVGKTYYMLTVLEKVGKKRPVHIITRSPNQYSVYKTSNEIKPID